MKIVIPGGSGQAGTILAKHFVARGASVTVLTRSPKQQPWKAVAWDAKTLGPWCDELEGADAVINLAGRSVNCRYTEQNRREIIDSRVDSTRIVGKAIQECSNPPKAWLQAATSTIYAHRYDANNDEETGILDQDASAPDTWRFSNDVARRWEAACLEADTPKTRKALMRISMIMSPDADGVFDVLVGLARKGLGGTLGDGRQYMSWIHDVDFCRSVDFIIDKELDGPVNLASPNPLSNKEFMRIVRTAANAKIGLPATKWMLEIGAVFMQTETELILKSRRVAPGKLLKAGFSFAFPEWLTACSDLYARWKLARK
jgi:uncharacterized protein